MLAIPFPARAMIALVASALLGAVIGTIDPAGFPDAGSRTIVLVDAYGN